MNKQKNYLNSNYSKSRKKVSCFSCFGRRKRSSTSTTMDFSIKNEPYDYVVEKLAIRKVPLSLFATEEDLEKHSATISSNSTVAPSLVSQSLKEDKKPVQMLPVEPNINDRPSVSFSSYYKFSPQPNIQQISRTEVRPHHQSSDITLSYESNEVAEIRYQTAFEPTPTRKILSEQQEKELVSHILNKHSSLFTLDPKEPVPKDPERAPKNRILVPSHVSAAIQNRALYYDFPPLGGRKQVHAQIHRSERPTVAPIAKYTTAGNLAKKELTPALKETINALGQAQKPRFPGFPPKNQRNITHVSDESTEHEMGCNVLGGDTVVENIPSHEILARSLESKKYKPDNYRNNRQKRISIAEESSYDNSDESDSYSEGSTTKVFYSEGTVPIDIHMKDIIMEQEPAMLSNKSVLTLPDKSTNQIRFLPINEAVNTSGPHMEDSEQITEISQLKGQSLKWKIIIKHHSDKKKEGEQYMDRSEESDTTDVDSKLNCKSLSTDR